MNEVAYNFWKRVDNCRGKEQLTKLAIRANVPYKNIKDQRSLNRLPKLEDAYNIASVLNVSLEFLITGENSELVLPPRVKAIALACCTVSDDGLLRSIEKLLDIPKKKPHIWKQVTSGT